MIIWPGGCISGLKATASDLGDSSLASLFKSKSGMASMGIDLGAIGTKCQEERMAGALKPTGLAICPA